MLPYLEKTGLVIVGAGPAGLAPLFAAASAGKLRQLLRDGVTIFEHGDRPGAGALTEYAIRSDSGAATFLDIVLQSKEPRLQALRWHPTTQTLLHLGGSAAPLGLVSSFLQLAGGVLCGIVEDSKRGRVFLNTEVLSVARTTDRRWRVRYRKAGSSEDREVVSQSVVLALGAHQPEERLRTEAVAGRPLLPHFGSKVIQSGPVLAHGGLTLVGAKIRQVRHPKVAVVGGSTSAGAVATQLLGPTSPIQFGQGSVTLLHRRDLRIYYASIAEAHAEGYKEFAPKDICRLTGRIYRFSGFRLDSRELIMAARGIGNRPPEPRLKLLQISSKSEEQARNVLEQADLIVAALGYRPKTLPVLDENGRLLTPSVPRASEWSIVDPRCRLLTRENAALSGLYAIGLATGPKADANLGGEVGFEGQVNSLWMWQHILGMRIVNQLLDEQTAYLQRTHYVGKTVPMPVVVNSSTQTIVTPVFAGGGA